MGRKVIATWICLAMVLGFIVIVDVTIDFTFNVEGTTLYVNTTGSGGAFTSIQDAINASKDGDTVFVFNGTYYEHVVVNKTINLTGADRDTTIINGGGNDYTVTMGSNANLSGFTITNCAPVDAGVRVSHYNTISNCNISSNNWYGMRLQSSTHNNISGNIISSNDRSGIYLFTSSNNNIISSNIIYSNYDYGIVISSSSNNIINGNNIHSNDYGVSLSSTHNTTLKNNTFDNNTIRMSGGLVSNWNSHIIENNTINGKPVYYYKNINGISAPNDASEVILGNCTNINVQGISSNGIARIELGFSNYTNISMNNIDSDYWLFIYQYYSLSNNISKNRNVIITLELSTNNNISENKNSYITLKNSDYNFIFGNDVSTTDYRIYLQESSHNIISNNNVTNGSLVIEMFSDYNEIIDNNVSNSYGITLYDSDLNNITQNIICSNINNGIHLWSSSGANNIIDNIISSNNMHGIHVDYRFSGWGKIENNTISYNKMNGIYLDGTWYMTIKNNTFIEDGIVLEGGSLNDWKSNEIENNTINGRPIYFYKNLDGFNVPIDAAEVILANCTNVSISRIDASNHDVGIELGYSSNITISDCNLSNDDWHGIYLLFTSNSSIMDNDVLSNEKDGIHIYFSVDCNITGNNISLNNEHGFYLRSSSNNSIFHNNIIDNAIQAYDYHSGNRWDNGYPSGGNFWSDYSGIDKFSGPNQDILGNDGIGDTNYSIEFNSWDNYPLMTPFGNFSYLYRGWNLISVPYIQPNTNMGTVLYSIPGSYDSVQWYNTTDTSDHWKHNHTLKPSNLNDLDDLDHTMGFWIHIIEPGGILFEYSGVQPTVNQTIILHPGWNLVGYPSLTNYNRTEGLNNLTFGTHVDAILTYNAATHKWKELGLSDYFEVGRGYWVHAKTKCEWEVPL